MLNLSANARLSVKDTSSADSEPSGINRKLVRWLVALLLLSSANASASLISNDVTYAVGEGNFLRLEHATFYSVSDGSFSGNTAAVFSGSTLSLNADWSIAFNVNGDDMFCPYCILQTYLSWAAPIPEFAGSYTIECLSNTLEIGPFAAGSINRNIVAPTTPGTYEIGVGWSWQYGCDKTTAPSANLGIDTATGGQGYRSFSINVVADTNPVPVPAAMWLFGTALIGMIGFSKRRKTA